ncbi:CotH kinase family protein [uncultured Fibrobacter sp.]|uniref:CotH kinase family protein n=1 Tax=uncultured Fibrobacter sp. TaxID=261512 RepID=UPI002634AD12|nr:CotH kinase family protein [uncultured Fibrobacter sp.]
MHQEKFYSFGVWVLWLSACCVGFSACSDSGSDSGDVAAPVGDSDNMVVIVNPDGDTVSVPADQVSPGDQVLTQTSSSSTGLDPLSSGGGEEPLGPPVDTIVPYVGNSAIIFSEVSPSNANLKDNDGNDPAWVELYNTSDDPVSLTGLALSDDMAYPQKWKFGDATIPAKGHLVVFLSGKNYTDYIPPSDSVNMVSTNCSAQSGGFGNWGGGFPGQGGANGGSTDVANLPGQSSICFAENGATSFGSVMKVSQNFMGGATSSFVVNTNGNVNLNKANQLVLRGSVDPGHKIRMSLNGGNSDWSKNLRGIEAGETTYYVDIAEVASKFTNVNGSTFTLESQGSETTTIKVTSYIARNRGHEPHTSFKVKNSGTLFLVNTTGVLDSVAYGELPVGTSWSRNATGSWGIAAPTPYGATLGEVFATQAQSAETVAPPSGFYSSPVSVSLPAGTRCETGGREPTINSALATQTLTISSTTVLRCVTYADGTYPSDMVNRTYVFEQQPSVPVFFITVDNDSMFNEQNGLYMKGNGASTMEPYRGANYWSNRELPVFVEMFEPGQTKAVFANKVSYKIKGQYSRAKEKKSFALTFREEFGEKRLKYPLFPEYPELKKFKSFVLRNNGNNYGHDYIRDRLGSSMTEGLGIDYQRGRAAVVYYNGSYFGIHSIRESNDEYYYENHYGYDPDDIDLIDAGNEPDAGSAEDFKALANWLNSNTLTSDANYNYVAERIDVNNYINYMQAEMFLDNRDWPGNNMKKWRVRSQKTKWKWFLYDLDYGFGTKFAEENGQIPLGNVFNFVTSTTGTGWPNGQEHTLLLRRLLENQNFKNAFINRFTTLLSMNFSEARLLKRIDALQSEVQSEIARDQQKWNLNASDMAAELATIKSYSGTRQAQIMSEMKEYFSLGETVPVTITVAGGGVVKVDGLTLDQSPITVNFFRDVPVTLTAVAGTGVFQGWDDGVTDATRTVVPGQLTSVGVTFK